MPMKQNIHPTFPLYFFVITVSNSKTGLKQRTCLYWEILLSLYLICVQGSIWNPTKALKITTFGAILSAVFP